MVADAARVRSHQRTANSTRRFWDGLHLAGQPARWAISAHARTAFGGHVATPFPSRTAIPGNARKLGIAGRASTEPLSCIDERKKADSLHLHDTAIKLLAE